MDVVQHLRVGYSINYTKTAMPSGSMGRNHKGATDFKYFVDDWLSMEIKLGRIRGPFASPPLKDFITSPLNSVAKSDPGDRRVIVDLSWPVGRGVNAGIDIDLISGESMKLEFPAVDDIIALIRMHGKGALLYKRDLRSAYRQFPVKQSDHHFLGYYWNGNYYYDTVLLMGQRSAAWACQRSTRAVAFIHRHQDGGSLVVYLDDFIGVGQPVDAWRGFTRLKDLLSDLGLDENIPKACAPSAVQTCLGVLFNTIDMTISITPDRLLEIRNIIDRWLRKRTANRRELQSIIGKLMFVSKCVRQSRVFMNRLLVALRSSSESRFPLSSDFRKDLVW